MSSILFSRVLSRNLCIGDLVKQSGLGLWPRGEEVPGALGVGTDAGVRNAESVASNAPPRWGRFANDCYS
jgi:hypothetical protein